MNKLPKWLLTSGLPAFNDHESFTSMEATYKLYQTMNNLIDEYNEFVDHYNSEWEQFETKYNSDIEVFTTSMRQEYQDFIDVVDVRLTNIETILNSDDVNLDTLQELVNALKNNVSSINDIFTELSKKQEKLVAGEGIKMCDNVISVQDINILYDEETEQMYITIGGAE